MADHGVAPAESSHREKQLHSKCEEQGEDRVDNEGGVREDRVGLQHLLQPRHASGGGGAHQAQHHLAHQDDGGNNCQIPETPAVT